jgi:hypothetical protein
MRTVSIQREDWAGLFLLAAVTAAVLELLQFHGPAPDGTRLAVVVVGVYAATVWIGPLVRFAGRRNATLVAIGLLVVARIVVRPVPSAGPVAAVIGLGALLLLARTLMVTSTAGGRLVPAGLALGGAGHAALVASSIDLASPGWAVTVAEGAVLLVLLASGTSPEIRPVSGFAWARGTLSLALLGPYLALAVPLTEPGSAATGLDPAVVGGLVVGGWVVALAVVASLRVPTWSKWLPQPDILLSAAVLVGAVVVAWSVTGWPAVVAKVLAQVTIVIVLSRALEPRPLDVLPLGVSLSEMPYTRRSTVAARVGWAGLGMGASYGLAVTVYPLAPELVAVAAAVVVAISAVIRRPWQPEPPIRRT